MPNMEAATADRILVYEDISRFGTPNIIYFDQGRQIESNKFPELCKLLQIKKAKTPLYHIQSDGMIDLVGLLQQSVVHF